MIMGKIHWHKQVLCLLVLVLSLVVINSSSSPNSTILCHPTQSFALLQFKKATSIAFIDFCSIPNLITDSWIAGTDCCSWDAVTCDKLTGNVIGLDLSCGNLGSIIDSNSSLFQLHHLQWLNLAFNDFSHSYMSSKFGQFRELTHLNLSFSGFSGPVPCEISHLSKLVSLDLSRSFPNDYPFATDNTPLRFEQQCFDLLIRNLTRLSVLHLAYQNMSFVEPPSLLNLSFSMTILNLVDTGIQGKFPDAVFRLPHLQELCLSDNGNLTGYLPNSNWSSPLTFLFLDDTKFTGEIPDSIGNLKSLKNLNFKGCHFNGSIPAAIGNLKRLKDLDLSSNSFSGQLPSSLSKLGQLTRFSVSANLLAGQIPDIFSNDLSKLTHLYLSYNNFSGQLPPSLFNHSFLSELDISSNLLTGSFPCHANGLGNLTFLDLSNNLLNGRVPSWLFTLPSLVFLNLGSNRLTGSIDEFEFQLPNSLSRVYLWNNDINGTIPISFFELVSLTDLDLSFNNLIASINLDMLSKLINLRALDLSNNRLISLGPSNNISYTFPGPTSLSLSSCNISEFPSFLRTMENLQWLDLSKNSIHGRIFQSELIGWKMLAYLNLSHNFLTLLEQHPWQEINVLDLRNNSLQGSLLVPPPSTEVFLVSDNKLSGRIPLSICNLKFIGFLDLSNNNLSGEIPPCLGNSRFTIVMLHLQMNNLHGSIPDTFSSGSWLTSLDLSGNNLEGPLPRSLANCSQLEVINFGNNKISDVFPCWLGAISELKILILRSNRFYGSLCDSRTIFSFPDLRIVDLSHNEFTGVLQTSFFKNLKAMMNLVEDESGVHYMGGDYYEDSVTLSMKGREVEMKRIITIFTSIDLSNNRFHGVIPQVLGNFKSLIVLNISNNALTGNIPSSLGNSAALESLDISSNKLDGRIPEQFKSLTFLEVLNLSYNQLWGPIPQGGQLSTFTNDSFIGNKGLCGEPLSVKCSNDGGLPQPSSVSDGFNWKMTMMGYASGVVIGLSMGYIVFSTGRPQWFVRKVEGDWKNKVIRRTRR